ncbi:MAG: 3-oxoacyl-ACP synthase III family protein [Myxococcaceae bacterium]
MSNERIARAVPGWTPERIFEKTGIRERRFLWDFDAEKGRAIAPPVDEKLYPANNSDMCEVALRQALQMAQLKATEIDAVFLVTCTPDELNFSHDAMELHRRLGMRSDTFALVVDDGCGGTPYVIDMARKMIQGGTFGTIAVVASAFTSPLVNREVYTSELSPGPDKKPLSGYLSMYVFGDGAGAVILRGDGAVGEGIVTSASGNSYEELVLRRGGGSVRHAHQGRASPAELAFIVDGPLVAQTYPAFMQGCLDLALSSCPELGPEVRRYYFHQPNKRLMDAFVARAGLQPSKVACNVDRYGNTSAAGMLILLAEDLETGVVKLRGGELVLLASVGANVHFGAQLVRL